MLRLQAPTGLLYVCSSVTVPGDVQPVHPTKPAHPIDRLIPADQPAQRLRVANGGWARWTPVNRAGIAAHVAGGAVLVAGNKGRLATQQGVAGATSPRRR